MRAANWPWGSWDSLCTGAAGGSVDRPCASCGRFSGPGPSPQRTHSMVTPARPRCRALVTINRATSAGNFLRCGHFLMAASVTGGPISTANCRYVSEIPAHGLKASRRRANRSDMGPILDPFRDLTDDKLVLG